MKGFELDNGYFTYLNGDSSAFYFWGSTSITPFIPF